MDYSLRHSSRTTQCPRTRLTPSLQTGLIALHSNRTERWPRPPWPGWARNPLAPLEDEVVLVQSNGMAEWFKMEAAARSGVCAAMRVELPSRFLWRTYRQVLGRAQVPARSPVDKDALAWRLVRLLPGLLHEPGYEPVAGFLAAGDDADRLFQLATRLADLFDQYQVYRPDWLGDWADGRDRLAAPGRPRWSCPPTSAGSLCCGVPCWPRWMSERQCTRPHIHQRVLDALHSGAPLARPVARRIVLFGMAQVPLPVLQLLAALAGTARCCWPFPTPAASTGPTPSTAASCCAWRSAASRCGPGATWLRCRWRPCTPMPTRCWPPGAARRDFVRQLDALTMHSRPRPALACRAWTCSMRRKAPMRPAGTGAEPHPRPGTAGRARPARGLAPTAPLFSCGAQCAARGRGAARPVVAAAGPTPWRCAAAAARHRGHGARHRHHGPAIRAVFGQYPRSDARYIRSTLRT